MSGDLISVRLLAVSGLAADRDLLRRAAGMIAVPLDMIEVESASAARSALALAKQDFDIVLLDSEIADRTACIEAARSAPRPPFVILVAPPSAASGELAAGVDGVVTKPTSLEQAKAVIERCIRVRLPKRVLVVDDSATMRSIVRKLFRRAASGSRSPKRRKASRRSSRSASASSTSCFSTTTCRGSTASRRSPRSSGSIRDAGRDHDRDAGRGGRRARAGGGRGGVPAEAVLCADIDAVLNSVYGLRPGRRVSKPGRANPRRRKSDKSRPVRSRRGRTRKRRNPACPCSRRRS